MHTLARREGHAPRWFTRCAPIRVDALVLAAALALASCPHSAHAGLNVWTSSGPDGAGVTALVVDPGASGTLYAGTAGNGVFKSIDRGATWREAKVGLGDISIDSLAIDPAPPTTLYAASPNRGVFKSTDGGESWADASADLPSLSAHWLAVDPSASAVYVSTNDGVFKSLDGGAHWMPTALLTKGHPDGNRDVAFFNAWIDCLAIDPSTSALYACYFAWADPTSSWDLLTSTDGGASWQALSVPTTGGPYAVAVDPATPGAVYVATYEPFGPDYAVQKTTDGGASWMGTGAMPVCGPDCRINALAVDSTPPATLYAATEHGVYTTNTDGSEIWRPLNTGMSDRAVTSVAVDPFDPTVAYAGTSGGVFSIVQAPSCSGDCNGDGVVSVAEVVALVDIALGHHAMQTCAAGDVGADDHITVHDLVSAITSALQGCAEPDRP